MASVKGGDALERKLAEIGKSLAKAETVHVGFLEGATYPDGTSVPMVAAIQEFGAPAAGQRTQAGRARAHGVAAVAKEFGLEAGIGIPPRPFFRNMIAAKSPGWGDAVAQTLKAADYDASKALAQVGAGVKGQLQQSIADLRDPPLKPSTVQAKGFDKPLVDTGHMMNSVDFKVE